LTRLFEVAPGQLDVYWRRFKLCTRDYVLAHIVAAVALPATYGAPGFCSNPLVSTLFSPRFEACAQ